MQTKQKTAFNKALSNLIEKIKISIGVFFLITLFFSPLLFQIETGAGLVYLIIYIFFAGTISGKLLTNN